MKDKGCEFVQYQIVHQILKPLIKTSKKQKTETKPSKITFNPNLKKIMVQFDQKKTKPNYRKKRLSKIKRLQKQERKKIYQSHKK